MDCTEQPQVRDAQEPVAVAPRAPGVPLLADRPERLRVALIAGLVGVGGAEKQLIYMAQALQEAGVEVRIYSLSIDKFHRPALDALGLDPCWVGRYDNPLLRLATITARLRAFRPHVVQATHFFTNLYATLAGRLVGALAIGCSRNDIFSEVRDCGGWGRWLLRMPPTLLANSHAAKRNAEALHVPPEKIHVIANVIDLADFDARAAEPAVHLDGSSRPVVIVVGRLFPQKRFDRFLAALALARRTAPALKGAVVGEGPERPALEQQAAALGLVPDGVAFLGQRYDVPAILGQADLLALSSDYEGFPNVVLEAMAARLPVVTTPAGDADVIVQDGVTGSVVPFEGTGQMADALARLALEPDLRRRFGSAGRAVVEQHYSFDRLAVRLFAIYRSIALQRKRSDLFRLFPE
jgi:glycosyltransferase involved in cell wall biosynthesis